MSAYILKPSDDRTSHEKVCQRKPLPNEEGVDQEVLLDNIDSVVSCFYVLVNAPLVVRIASD